MFETGQIEHILAAIDNIVNGEVNLPPGEHTKLFERIREVGKGYTVIGTNYTYNSRNQLVHRENLTRYEDYDYKYDDQGSLLTDSRSKYEWNALGQLTEVTFPDGFGEKYAYDMLGRRTSKTQFNHTGETQEVTNFTYKGDTWVITEEKNELDEVTKSYTFDANDRPLTITYKGEIFWYVYNGHGDVMAMTDKDGNVAARYEYDAWGLVSRMYNRYGERVREGIGWIGDLGTGNGSPGSVQGPEDDSGNTVPDYHPGNGNGKAKGNGKGATEEVALETPVSTEVDSTETSTVTLDLSAIVAEETKPTADITTELVKENPIRYAGYYFDRKTQFYYLQARYYDPRPARFISEDSFEGEIENPQSLNLYVYVQNNPLNFTDPTGHCIAGDEICESTYYYDSNNIRRLYFTNEVDYTYYANWYTSAPRSFYKAVSKGNRAYKSAMADVVLRWDAEHWEEIALAYSLLSGMGGLKIPAKVTGNAASPNTSTQSAGQVGRYSGTLVKVNKADAAADALAKRIGGQSRVKFSNEFDVVSKKYVAQTKPALQTLNKSVRDQMKATFEAAQETGRKVYYHFEGQPVQSVINKLNEYSARYGTKVVIDTKPLMK